MERKTACDENVRRAVIDDESNDCFEEEERDVAVRAAKDNA